MMKKTAVITGADGGMGSEITKAVAMAGYHVIMVCYTSFKGEEKRSRIILDTGNEDIEVVQADLSSMESVLDAVDKIKDKTPSVELLMNNAGTMCTHYVRTEDGFEHTVAVNYLAPYLLTRRLLPIMHEGREGSFFRIPIYSNTKLALWLFTRALSERVKGRGITVNAADPGIVSTNIIRMDEWFDPLTDIFFRPFIRTPRQGAETAIRLLLDEQFGNLTGRMFASSKEKKVSEKYMHHPQTKELWKMTEQNLGRFLDSGEI